MVFIRSMIVGKSARALSKACTIAIHSALLVELAAKSIQQELQLRRSQEDAWNNSAFDLVRASGAHCHYVVVKLFTDKLLNISDTGVHSVITTLALLYALQGVTKNCGDFLQVYESFYKYLKPLHSKL